MLSWICDVERDETQRTRQEHIDALAGFYLVSDAFLVSLGVFVILLQTSLIQFALIAIKSVLN